jgi:DNA-binding PadR family transcriptional regulator
MSKRMFEQLSNAEQRILKQLAQKGEATGYMLCIWDRELKRGTTRDALRNLENKKLIKLVRIEKHKPRNKKYYDISLPGLLVFLSERKNWLNRNGISDIAKKHPNMIPLIFGNWTYFVSAGVRDKVIEVLRKLFADEDVVHWLYLVASGVILPPRTYNEAQMDRLGEYTIIEQITKRVLFEGFDPQTENIGELAVGHLITRHVLFLGLDPRFYNLYEYKINGKAVIDPELLKWIPILVGNDILKEYALEYLEDCREYFTERLEHVKLWNFLIRAASRSKGSRKIKKPLTPEEEKILHAIYGRIFEKSN